MNSLLDLKLREFYQKYWDLVWYARKSPADLLFSTASVPAYKVEVKYPQECRDLQGDDGNWHHGFNSGMLACLNLVQQANELLLCSGPEFDGHCERCRDNGTKDCMRGVTRSQEEALQLALDEFPFLDT
jgi:hypothetical protein